MPIYFKNQTAEHLFTMLDMPDLTLRTVRRLQGYVCRKGVFPAVLPEVSPRMLAELLNKTMIPSLTLIEKNISDTDGFAKYLFRGEGDGLFEAVRIPVMNTPGKEGYIICVSSQAGCSLGCAFCQTAKLGFTRNLAAWEIVDQVMQLRDDSDFPVKGVVFMGMGEPLLNYQAVMDAAAVISEPCGLAVSGRAVTISTSGIIPGILALADGKYPYRLVVSLSAADHEKRSALMPIEKKYPLEKLMAALRKYHAATGQLVTLAWTMISGLNTGEDDALQLAALTEGLSVKLDLIDVNDPSGKMLPPDEQELSRFRDYLRKHCSGMPVARRYSGGKDINAACGMLAGTVNNVLKSAFRP